MMPCRTSRRIRPARSLVLPLALTLAMTLAGPVVAQAPPSIDGRIEHLKPGEYLWAPEIAPAGPVTVIVSLATQKAYAYRNGVAIGVSTV